MAEGPTGDARVPDPGLDLGSVRVACVTRGRGTPVVLVHGSNSDLRSWDPVLDELGRDYRVVAYSRRYHWPNAPIAPGADYTEPEHAADLEALLRRLDAAPAHIVGHSYGALVALQLALRRPQLCRSLVLAEPPAITLFTSPEPRPAELLRLLARRPRTALAIVRFGATGVAPARAALARGDEATALRRMGAAVLGKEVFARLPRARLEQARRNFIAAELTGSGFARLADDDLERLHVPTLLLLGQRSPPLFHRIGGRLRELLPALEVAQIPGASHLMHEDNPGAWLRTVRGFLAAHAARGAGAPGHSRPAAA